MSLKTQKRRGIVPLIVFFISISFVLFLFKQYEPINTIDCTPEIMASKPDVILLGTSWCGYCYQAKSYFQRNNIHYCEYNVESSAIGKQLYKKHGAAAVPILLIGGYQLNGFSEQRVESALALIKQ